MPDQRSALQLFQEQIVGAAADATFTGDKARRMEDDIRAYQKAEHDEWAMRRFGRTSDALIEAPGPTDVLAPMLINKAVQSTANLSAKAAAALRQYAKPYDARTELVRGPSATSLPFGELGEVSFRSGRVPMHDFDFFDPALHTGTNMQQYTISKADGIEGLLSKVKPLTDAGHELDIYETVGGWRVFDKSAEARSMTPHQYFGSSRSPAKAVESDPFYKQNTMSGRNGAGYWFRTSGKPGRVDDFVARKVANVPGEDRSILSSVELLLNHDLPIAFNTSEVSRQLQRLSHLMESGSEHARYIAQQFNVSTDVFRNFVTNYQRALSELEIGRKTDRTPREVIDYIIATTKNNSVKDLATNFRAGGKGFPGVVSVHKTSEGEIFGNFSAVPAENPVGLIEYLLKGYKPRADAPTFSYNFNTSRSLAEQDAVRINALSLFDHNQPIPSNVWKHVDEFMPTNAEIPLNGSSFSGDSAPMLATLLKSGKATAGEGELVSILNPLGRNSKLSQAINEYRGLNASGTEYTGLGFPHSASALQEQKVLEAVRMLNDKNGSVPIRFDFAPVAHSMAPREVTMRSPLSIYFNMVK